MGQCIVNEMQSDHSCKSLFKFCNILDFFLFHQICDKTIWSISLNIWSGPMIIIAFVFADVCMNMRA